MYRKIGLHVSTLNLVTDTVSTLLGLIREFTVGWGEDSFLVYLTMMIFVLDDNKTSALLLII